MQLFFAFFFILSFLGYCSFIAVSISLVGLEHVFALLFARVYIYIIM